MSNDDYHTTLARMRAERHYREANQRVGEIAEEHREAERARDEAVDAENWSFWDQECERLEQEYHHLVPPQPQQLSDKKLRFIADRWDLPHSERNLNLARGAHVYITQAMGVPEDSDQYFELMRHVVEPVGYQPPISPDEICRELGLEPKEYNKQVRRLEQAKAAGLYRDR